MEQGYVLDTIDHPNQDKYPNQKIYVIENRWILLFSTVRYK